MDIDNTQGIPKIMVEDGQSVTPGPSVFPPPQHAKLSPRSYLERHLRQGCRPSGRSLQDFREPIVHTGSLTHANGSSVVRIGDSSVVCGIRVEILPASEVVHASFQDKPDHSLAGLSTQIERDRQELAYLNLIIPNVELNTGCSADILPGGPPSSTAQILTQKLLVLLNLTNMVELSRLRIWGTNEKSDSMLDLNVDGADAGPRVEAFWAIYIDVLFTSLDHGATGSLDAVWTAVSAALYDTTLPSARYDYESERILCDARLQTYTPLMNGTTLAPILSTFGVFRATLAEISTGSSHLDGDDMVEKTHTILDPDAFEEGVCNGTIVILSRSESELVQLEIIGDSTIDDETLGSLIRRASEKTRNVQKVLAVSKK